MSVFSAECPYGCPWRIADEDQELVADALANHVLAHTDPEPTQEDDVAPTPRCKIEDCDRPCKNERGLYGGLCITHIAEKKAAKTGPAVPAASLAGDPPADATNVASGGASTNGHISLPDLAQAVEDSRRQLHEAFQALADELERQKARHA